VPTVGAVRREKLPAACHSATRRKGQVTRNNSYASLGL
jgi:hypothetical protein